MFHETRLIAFVPSPRSPGSSLLRSSVLAVDNVVVVFGAHDGVVVGALAPRSVAVPARSIVARSSRGARCFRAARRAPTAPRRRATDENPAVVLRKHARIDPSPPRPSRECGQRRCSRGVLLPRSGLAVLQPTALLAFRPADLGVDVRRPGQRGALAAARETTGLGRYVS